MHCNPPPSAHVDWLMGIPAACADHPGPGGSGCGLDARNTSFFVCAANHCQLNYDEGVLFGMRGFYTYAAGTPTPFTRRLWISPLPSGREAEMTVKVSWQSGIFGGVKTVTIQSRLFNQYNNL